MLQDEVVYPDPSTFRPERFLTKEGKLNLEIQDPAAIAFGFGRRSAAADYSVTCTCAKMFPCLFLGSVQADILHGLLCGYQQPWYLQQ